MYRKGIITASFMLVALAFLAIPVSAQVPPQSTSTKAVSGKHLIKKVKKTVAVKKVKKKQKMQKIQTVAIAGNEFSFLPNEIHVKKGARVRVIFTNTGKYPHNFVINELNVKSKTIKSGKKTNVIFTANKTGSFQFYCSVPGHLDKGMKGTIVVE